MGLGYGLRPPPRPTGILILFDAFLTLIVAPHGAPEGPGVVSPHRTVMPDSMFRIYALPPSKELDTDW